jgi:histone arginine demethylase JMJD6
MDSFLDATSKRAEDAAVSLGAAAAAHPGEISERYLTEVRRRADDAHVRATAALSDVAAAEAAVAQLPIFSLDVRDASNLSVAECRTEYVAKYRPLVITGLGSMTDPSPWTLDWIARECRSKQVAVNLGGSQRMAACTVAGVEVMTFAELQRRVEGRTEPRAYLYDCALPLKVPLMCERVGVPHYFAHDWLQRTRRLHAFSRSWPSLFVGSPGTRSSLHIDQWKGHFWMCQLQGCKRWTVFHPEDLWCLHPTWDLTAPRLEPTFPDLDHMEAHPEQYPLLRLARRVDHVLRAGEVLLVPGGAPHRVVNGEDDGDETPSVAIAGNFIDSSNRDGAVADLSLMAARIAGAALEPGAAATASALAELDLNAADDFSAESPPDAARHAVPWAEYARGRGAEPTAELCYWLEDASDGGRARDDCAGDGPLRPASDYVDERSSEGSTCFWDTDGAHSTSSDGE